MSMSPNKQLVETWTPQEAGEPVRLSMAEVFVIRDGKIAERRAWVIPLTENEHR